jgi:hypothetical protein
MTTNDMLLDALNGLRGEVIHDRNERIKGIAANSTRLTVLETKEAGRSAGKSWIMNLLSAVLGGTLGAAAAGKVGG